MSFVCPALPGFFVGWRGAFAREGLVLRRAFGACAAGYWGGVRLVFLVCPVLLRGRRVCYV